MKITFFIFFIFLLNTCSKEQEINSKIAASVDSSIILLDSIDKSIRQEIYDELNRIYLIRKVALEQAINDKVLELETKKQRISLNELKENIVKGKLTINNMICFAKKTSYPNSVPELRETLILHDVNSAKGQELLASRYKNYLISQFIDSVKKLHNIKILLSPPRSPFVNIKNLLAHFKSNSKGQIPFLLASDFDCHVCREQNPLFEKLYEKYKDKVQFGFTHYGSYVSNSAIASECAANQGKFWEMHDSIFKTKAIPDSVALFRIARNLKLDMGTFSKDYRNKGISDKIHENLIKLESAGIYGTPTIMINNRLIFNNTSLDEIEKLLNDEIEKSN